MEQLEKDVDIVRHVVRRGDCKCGAIATRGSASPVPTCVSDNCTHFRMMFMANVSVVGAPLQDRYAYFKYIYIRLSSTSAVWLLLGIAL